MCLDWPNAPFSIIMWIKFERAMEVVDFIMSRFDGITILHIKKQLTEYQV